MQEPLNEGAQEIRLGASCAIVGRANEQIAAAIATPRNLDWISIAPVYGIRVLELTEFPVIPATSYEPLQTCLTKNTGRLSCLLEDG